MVINSLAGSSAIGFQGPTPRVRAPEETADPARTSEAKPQEAETRPAESPSDDSSANPGELTPQEQRVVDSLKQRDIEVRAHEQAHLAAAGQFATGGISFQFQTGPDGQRYAVGGEVGIDTSAIPGDPAATAAKMAAIRQAALAPADPSPQDLRVAARASQVELAARAEASRPETDEGETQAGEAAGQSGETEDRTVSGGEERGIGVSGGDNAASPEGPAPPPGQPPVSGADETDPQLAVLSTPRGNLGAGPYGQPSPFEGRGTLINVTG